MRSFYVGVATPRLAGELTTLAPQRHALPGCATPKEQSTFETTFKMS